MKIFRCSHKNSHTVNRINIRHNAAEKRFSELQNKQCEMKHEEKQLWLE